MRKHEQENALRGLYKKKEKLTQWLADVNAKIAEVESLELEPEPEPTPEGVPSVEANAITAEGVGEGMNV